MSVRDPSKVENRLKRPLTVLDRLRAKYPHWENIVSEPAKDCSCKGSGERHTKSGLSVPCLCVCLSDVPDFDRAETVEAVGDAARRLNRPK